jgi:hypothetical protein
VEQDPLEILVQQAIKDRLGHRDQLERLALMVNPVHLDSLDWLVLKDQQDSQAH